MWLADIYGEQAVFFPRKGRGDGREEEEEETSAVGREEAKGTAAEKEKLEGFVAAGDRLAELQSCRLPHSLSPIFYGSGCSLTVWRFNFNHNHLYMRHYPQKTCSHYIFLCL